MSAIFKKVIFLVLLNFLFVCVFNAQTIESCSYIDNFPRNERLPDNVRERMIKLCIEDNKKEYNELIERSEEVAKLTKEIEESFNENNKLSNKDQKKLQEVEKLLNKIRKDLLASNDDDKDEDEKPSSLVNAIQDLQKNTTELLSALKKTTRHSISVTAIKSSNAVLKLVKFLRFGN